MCIPVYGTYLQLSYQLFRVPRKLKGRSCAGGSGMWWGKMPDNPMRLVQLLANAPRNCWVALNDAEDAIAGFGHTITDALEQARKAGVKNPLVLWSPGAVEASTDGRETLEPVVLVVDNDEDSCELACAMLEVEGYTALPAESGETALQLARENSIDVLLTEVLMPVMDGRQLAERIGAVRPNVKMLFMSASVEDPLVQNLIGKYEMCFLRKPFSTEALVGKLEWVLADPDACDVPVPEDPPEIQPKPAA